MIPQVGEMDRVVGSTAGAEGPDLAEQVLYAVGYRNHGAGVEWDVAAPLCSWDGLGGNESIVSRG